MATPLPRSWYFDRGHFEKEMRAVFAHNWLPVAHTCELADPGAYIATHVGGHDIIVVCGEDKIVRAFYNVCQHRAHRLLDGSGCLKEAITCPYHAWRYSLDGALQYARHSDKVAGFDETRFGLSAIATLTFAGFIAVGFNDSMSTPCASLRKLEDLLLADHPSLPVMREVRRREAVLQANWKTIVENYLECYHCNVAHPSFGNFDLTTWKHLVGDGWSRQGRVGANLDDTDIDHDDIIGLSVCRSVGLSVCRHGGSGRTFSGPVRMVLTPLLPSSMNRSPPIEPARPASCTH